jgi:hypothetical protein
MCVQEKREYDLKKQRDEFFNRIWPNVPLNQWKVKTTRETLKTTEVAVTEEQETTVVKVPTKADNNWSDSDTPTRLVQWEDNPGRSDSVEILLRFQYFLRNEVPILEDDKEEMIDYEPSPSWEDMDILAWA